MELPIDTTPEPINSSTLANDTSMELLSESEDKPTIESCLEEDNTSKEYQVTDNDVQLLQKQIEVDENKARELLAKYRGDYVEALMELYNTNYVAPPSMGLGSSSTKTLELDGILQDHHQITIEEASTKYPVIENILNPEPEFLEKFKTAYTYMIAPLSLENNGITKFKKYGTLPEVIKEKVVEIVNGKYNLNKGNLDEDKLKRWSKNRGTLKSLIEKQGKEKDLTPLKNIQSYLKLETVLSKIKDSQLDIHPLQGNSQELLDKWDMNSAGLVFFKKQIRTKNIFLSTYSNHQYLVNRNATELARQNGIIDNDHIIIGHCAIINPCY